MASRPAPSTYSQVTKGQKPRDPSPANQHRDINPLSVMDANSQLQPQPHQPMYRKREVKAGQKEKRVLKKTPNSPSSRKKHGTNAKNHNGKSENKNNNNNQPKPKSSNSKTTENKNNSKNKTKKQNSKTKKKPSKLAFWFCMSSNADAKDCSSQAPVSKPPKLKPSIERTQASLDREITLETPTEILATKYSRRNACKRHSAPPSSEWTRIVTTAIVESPSQPPRSRTPTGGVRYRYDGTLERPYVYPGGLTFHSGGDKSRRKSNSSLCDTTLEDASLFDHRDKDDDFDITRKFYLRFDDDPTESSYSKDRRFSVPSDCNVADRKQVGQRLHSPDTIQSNSFAGRGHEDNYPQDQNVIYDIPYESDSDKEGENEVEHEHEAGKRNSYYSKPLQNSGCIYMWHSCEDLQHCEEKYHSKEGIDRICLNCKGNTPPRCQKDIHTGYDNGGDDFSISSSPMASVSPDRNVVNEARKMSLPIGLTLEYSLPGSTQRTGLSNSDTKATVPHDDTPRNGGVTEGTETTAATLVKDSSESSQYTATQNESPSLPDQSQRSNSPFRRDIGRSSCMPGNKRFFLPPPPCYTPPKEEMEVALTTISKISCHRGSQTDLTEDIDPLDMEDRDLSLKRPEVQRQTVMTSQNVRVSSGAETSTDIGTDTHELEDKRSRKSQIQEETSNPLVENKPSNDTQDNLTTHDPNQNTKPAQTARTSTPKPSRRSGQQGEDLKVFCAPKPLPRKRIPSKDLTPSASTPERDAVQSTEFSSDNQTVHSLPNTVAATISNKVPPVPKKRRSQMVEADLSYTFADIEKALAECKGNTLPRDVRDPNAAPVNKNLRQDSQNIRSADEKQTSQSDASGKPSGPLKPSFLQIQSTPSKDQNQPNLSPQHRGRLNSSLGSSIDCGYAPRRFVALSPSLDNMVDVFQERTYDPDNEDNCNADDEMSIYNEDIYPVGSASVQILLRSRSIFDRSLAVTRKRRQRLRDRKCHSQLLSSADIDEYDKEMSRSHLWKPRKCDCHEKRPPGFLLPNGVSKHLLKPQLLLERNLWKHSYTDSGNDSDMVSPIDLREHKPVEDVFQGSYPSSEMWKQAVKCDCVKITPEKKSWELRLKVKHELRKARSIEHLYLAQQDARAGKKKPSLETCV